VNYLIQKSKRSRPFTAHVDKLERWEIDNPPKSWLADHPDNRTEVHDLQPLNVDENQPLSNDANDCVTDNGHDIAYDGHFQPTNDSLMSDEVYSDRN